MEKKDSVALHEQLKETLKENQNETFFLLTSDGEHGTGTMEGNAWDLISLLQCVMEHNPDIANVIREAAKLNALHSMRAGLQQMLDVLDEMEDEEPAIAPTDGN